MVAAVGGSSKRSHHHVPISALPPSLLLRRCGNCLARALRWRASQCGRWRTCCGSLKWEDVGSCFENCLDWLIRTLGPFYVVLALVLIGSVIYLYFTLLLPAAFEAQPRWMAALHVAGAMWLAFNILFNYFLCILTDPGHPALEPALMSFMTRQLDEEAKRSSSTWRQQHGQQEPSMADHHRQLGGHEHGRRTELQSAKEGVTGAGVPGLEGSSHAAVDIPGDEEDRGPLLVPGPQTQATATATMNFASLPLTFRWCKLCKRRKAPMTHHCYVCKRCVLKMDHHCPWMNNCVGYRNYRYFFCFVLNLWVGCLYAVEIAASLLFSKHKLDTGVIFTFVVALAVFIALTLLLVWHLYLVSTAQTTIDFYDYRVKRREAKRVGKAWRNEFDLGFKSNLVVALQLAPPLWGFGLLLPQVVHMKGDGMTFPTTNSTITDSTQTTHTLLTQFLGSSNVLDPEMLRLEEKVDS